MSPSSSRYISLCNFNLLFQVLFQDVHTSHIIVDEEESGQSEDEEDEDEDGEEELVLENGHTPTPQDVRSRFLASTG